MNLYLHRNGEPESPIQNGDFWFRGIGRYAPLSREFKIRGKCLVTVTEEGTIAFVDQFNDQGARETLYLKTHDMIGEWYGPILAPWHPDIEALQSSDRGSPLPKSLNAQSADLRGALAGYAHRAWSGWMKYLFTKGYPISQETPGGTKRYFVINPESYARWQRQAETPFHYLESSEQMSDYKEADEMLEIIRAWGHGLPDDFIDAVRCEVEEFNQMFEPGSPDLPFQYHEFVKFLEALGEYDHIDESRL